MAIAVSVVCPFYNEAEGIVDAALGMIDSLVEQFDDWELILVNDGSTDDSLQILTNALNKETHECVRVISHPRNQGRGRALKSGIDVAGGDIIVTTEADGSWGTDIVRRLVDELEAKPEIDFVIASPHLLGGGLKNVPFWRSFLTRIGNRLISLFFERGITMNTGMTRAYRRKVIQPLVTSENGKEFHLEVLLKLSALGFKAGEIPATITWPEKRVRKKSTRKSSINITKTIGTHLRFLAIAQPMRYFAYVAILSLIMGIGFMVAAIVMLLLGKVSVFFGLLSLMMYLFCLLCIGFSVVFVLLREILRETWMHDYPGQRLPSALPSTLAYPADVDIE